MNEPEPPRISRASAAIASTALGAMAIATAAGFAVQVLVPYAKTGIPPADWSGLTIAIVVLGLVGLYAYLGATVYQRFATVVSAAGVSVPTLRGRRNVSWSDIQRVGVRGHEVLLETPQGKIVINVFCFADSKALTTYVQSHLPPSSPGGSVAV